MGAASELVAASHFLRQGFQVYWPSVQQSCVDFVSYRDGQYRKVQVKTATWNRGSPPWAYLQCRVRPTNKYEDDYDDLVVVHGSDLWVIPRDCIDTSNLCLAGSKPGYRKSRWDAYKANL